MAVMFLCFITKRCNLFMLLLKMQYERFFPTIDGKVSKLLESPLAISFITELFAKQKRSFECQLPHIGNKVLSFLSQILYLVDVLVARCSPLICV